MTSWNILPSPPIIHFPSNLRFRIFPIKFPNSPSSKYLFNEALKRNERIQFSQFSFFFFNSHFYRSIKDTRSIRFLEFSFSTKYFFNEETNEFDSSNFFFLPLYCYYLSLDKRIDSIPPVSQLPLVVKFKLTARKELNDVKFRISACNFITNPLSSWIMERTRAAGHNVNLVNARTNHFINRQTGPRNIPKVENREKN